MQCTIAIYSIQYGCCITAIPLSLGVGGRGLCEGEAENRAGKAALSRTKASGKAAERSEVLSLLAVVRGASR